MFDQQCPVLHKRNRDEGFESFPWQYDMLDRKPVGKDLIKLIASIRDPFVISFDASYGEGKSYFLTNLQRDMECEGYLTVSFNAWETDYSDDPLLAFIASIDQQLQSKKFNVDPETGELSEPLKKLKAVCHKGRDIGVGLLTKALPIVASSFIKNKLGDEGWASVKDIFTSDIEDRIASSTEDALRAFAEKTLTAHVQHEKSINAFREMLHEEVWSLTKELDEDRKKLIIFVDELDRCRPTYAVEILERIKHLFSVEGVVFVLGIDEKQVANAMTAVYGAKLDTDGYLRRFIDWRFKLPKPSATRYAEHLGARFYFGSLNPPFLGNTQYDSLQCLTHSFGIVSHALGLTLRQQEQCFTEMNILLRTLEAGQSPFSIIMGVLLPLRVANYDLYEAAFTKQKPGPVKFEEVRQLFQFLWAAIDAADLFSQLDNWKTKEEFEGEFIFWFTDRSLAQNINVKIEQCSKVMNSGNNGDYSLELEVEKDRAKKEMTVWNACMGISFTFPPRAWAHIVRDRLNRADTYIKGQLQ